MPGFMLGISYLPMKRNVDGRESQAITNKSH